MESLDIEKLKKLAKNAAEIADEISENYRLEAFKLLFSKFLNTYSSSQLGTIPVQQMKEVEQQIDDTDPLQKLAKICNIPKDDLKNVISISGNEVELICRLSGSEANQQIIGSLVLLLTREIIFDEEWVKSSTLLNSLKKIGIQDKGSNFSTRLKKHSDLILKKPSLQEYMLTTNNGRKIAANVIEKLSRSEEVSKEDLKS